MTEAEQDRLDRIRSEALRQAIDFYRDGGVGRPIVEQAAEFEAYLLGGVRVDA